MHTLSTTKFRSTQLLNRPSPTYNMFGGHIDHHHRQCEWICVCVYVRHAADRFMVIENTDYEIVCVCAGCGNTLSLHPVHTRPAGGRRLRYVMMAWKCWRRNAPPSPPRQFRHTILWASMTTDGELSPKTASCISAMHNLYTMRMLVLGMFLRKI